MPAPCIVGLTCIDCAPPRFSWDAPLLDPLALGNCRHWSWTAQELKRRCLASSVVSGQMCSGPHRTGKELGDIQSFDSSPLLVLCLPSCEFLGFGRSNLFSVCPCFSLLLCFLSCNMQQSRAEDLFVYMTRSSTYMWSIYHLRFTKASKFMDLHKKLTWRISEVIWQYWICQFKLGCLCFFVKRMISMISEVIWQDWICQFKICRKKFRSLTCRATLYIPITIHVLYFWKPWPFFSFRRYRDSTKLKLL